MGIDVLEAFTLWEMMLWGFEQFAWAILPPAVGYIR